MNTVCFLNYKIVTGQSDIFHSYYINVIDANDEMVYSNHDIVTADELKIEMIEARESIIDIEMKKPA